VHFLERVVSTPPDIPIDLEELRSVSEPSMIVRMTTRPVRSDVMTIGSETSFTEPGT
jgi:hypothetical protein